MKPKAYFVLTVCVLLSLVFSSPSKAFFNSDVKKAKEFMAAGMYPQAIELLNKRINDKPTDAEAHYQLGICYINTGNFRGADERFASAVRLKADYGYKIGDEYKKAGSEALNKGNTRKAQNLFKKAVQYQPNLRQEIAKECFSAGQAYLDQRQSNIADGLLSMAVKYDSSLSENSDTITKEYGQKLLAIAKEKPKKDRRPHVNEALKYLSQKDVDKVFPPPTWQDVPGSEIRIPGKGFGKSDKGEILVKIPGLKKNDQIIVSASKFQIYGNDNSESDWPTYYNQEIIEYDRKPSGYPMAFKASKGEDLVIKLKRLTGSY